MVKQKSGLGTLVIPTRRVTQDTRNDFAPSHWGNIISWQKAKGWPFGWEIMALVGDTRMQLTTNFYYDMGPKVQGDKIVWYGWDGFDYEIYMFDAATTSTVQITSNRYDDVAPTVWGDVVVWEGYSAVEADIFMWRNGEITKISNNIDDDLYPRIWNNKSLSGKDSMATILKSIFTKLVRMQNQLN